MSVISFAQKDIATTLVELGTSEKGLTHEQMRAKTLKYGKNIVATDSNSWFGILLRQFSSPFVYLLAAAFFLTLVLGEHLDALMIFLFVTINAFLGFYQEHKSESTLKLLKKYLVSKVKVVREGVETSIEVENLVPGDIVCLEPGDIVPADMRIIDSYNFSVNESVLTGESVPTEKDSRVLKVPSKQITDATNICFSGTTVVGGRAKCAVIAIGKDTSFGEIAKLATSTKKVSTFEKEIGKFSRFILILVVVTLFIVLGANIIFHRQASPVGLIIFAIALAVSVIPEALPVVTTFSLSIGASRLAKKSVVVKRLSAIEDLGSIQILCSDKTGTLTQNILSIQGILSSDKKSTLIFANLASTYSPNSRNQGNNAFEIALLQALDPMDRKEISTYARIFEIPFDPIRKRASSVVERKGKYELVVRGAPEDVLGICVLSPVEMKKYSAWVSKKGQEGIRVLAIAKKRLKKQDINNASDKEKNMEFLGLLAFADPVKPSTLKAVELAASLGVKVKIITGDSREVAGAVAHQIGLITDPSRVLSGEQLDVASSRDQHKLVHEYDVFCRVAPAQKYKILQLLKETAEVGFLGEGINDAPALKEANVGLVVEGAADIARESADIVLLDKSLQVVVDGIKEGREVFANTSKYINATLSANFGNFFAIAIVSLIIDFLPMLPLQILLVNLLSDFPMISVATDNVDEKSIATPRHYDLKSFALMSLLLGIVSTFYDFLFFGVFFGSGEKSLQTCWFIGSIVTELLFLFSIRSNVFFLKSKRPSFPLILLTGIAFVATVTIPFTSFGHSIFGFISPTPTQIVTIAAIVAMYFASTESVKLLYYRFFSK